MRNSISNLKSAFASVAFLGSVLSFSAVGTPDWVGFYLGAGGGYQFGQTTNKTGAFGYNADNQEWKYGESGLTGSALVGFNARWNGFIVGSEFDWGYLRLSGKGAQPDSPGDDTVGESNGDFYSSLRARIGMEQGHWLLYANAGVMVANYDKHIFDSCAVAPCGGTTFDAHKKSFNLGYAIGAGAERRMDKQWSVKLEYLYFDLGSQSVGGMTSVGSSYEWDAQTAGHIIRAAFIYHLGESEDEIAPITSEPALSTMSND